MNSHPPAPLRRLVALAALSLSLLLPTAAAAQSSIDGYSPDDGAVQNQIESGGSGSGGAPETSARASSGSDSASLPFTGMDLGLLAAAGALLVGVGGGMRLILRPPPAVR